MQKVLFVASTYSHIRNFHLPYLREFHARGWEVSVACGNIPEPAPHPVAVPEEFCSASRANSSTAAHDGTLASSATGSARCRRPDFIDRIIDLPFEKRMTAPANFRASSMLRRLFKTEKYDLVVTHTSLAAFFARLALYGVNADAAPRVVNVTHGYLYDDATSAPKRALLRTAERIAARKTDLLLAMNAWDLAEAKRHALGREVAYIPGVGVDFERLTTPKNASVLTDFGIPEAKFVLFYAAEFSARKNQQLLIRAMAQLPPRVHLVLAGDGALKADCERLAASLGVADRVTFPGHVTEVGEWLAASDAAVSASRIEGLPFNIMEAMHAGLPTVASDVKGHADLIEHGKTGLLYPYDDARAFAAEVEALLASPDLCRALGAAAAASVERYSLEKVFPIVFSEYEKAVQQLHL